MKRYKKYFFNILTSLLAWSLVVSFAQAQQYASYTACMEDNDYDITTCCRINSSWAECRSQIPTSGCSDHSDCKPNEYCDLNTHSCLVGTRSNDGTGIGGQKSGTEVGNQTRGSSPGEIECGSGYEQVNGICLPEPTGAGLSNQRTIGQLAETVIKILLAVAGVAAVLFIIIGGMQYITAGGNEEQAEKGRKALINAVIGLVVVIMSYVIVNVIVNLLGKNQI